MPFRKGFRLSFPFDLQVRPCLIHICHAVPPPRHEYVVLKATSQGHGRGTAWYVWIKAYSHIPCLFHAVLRANSHIPCCSHAVPLPFSDSAVSFVEVPYFVHEVLLPSPSSNYLLLNCYNLCAVNYACTHVIAPKQQASSMTNVALFHTGHLHLRLVCFW
jgi:hypothetical protein